MTIQNLPEGQALQSAILIEEKFDRYVIRVRCDDLPFDQIASTIAARSFLLLGQTGNRRFQIIDVVSLSEPIDTGQTEATLDGPELVFTLVKVNSDACANSPKS